MEMTKNNKATGHDGIKTEKISTLDEFSIYNIINVMEEIDIRGQTPEGQPKYIFATLFMRPGANKGKL